MYSIVKNGLVLYVGTAEVIREKLEFMLEDKLDFFTMLQEEDTDEYFEVYMHTENYEDLEEHELDILSDLGITDDISKDEICKYLGIEINEVRNLQEVK